MGKSRLLKYMSEPSGDILQRDKILIFSKKLRLLLMGMGGWQCHHDKTCQAVEFKTEDF